MNFGIESDERPPTTEINPPTIRNICHNKIKINEKLKIKTDKRPPTTEINPPTIRNICHNYMSHNYVGNPYIGCNYVGLNYAVMARQRSELSAIAILAIAM